MSEMRECLFGNDDERETKYKLLLGLRSEARLERCRMTYLVFMNDILLVTICWRMGIIGDNGWISLVFLGMVALVVHFCLKEGKKNKNK